MLALVLVGGCERPQPQPWLWWGATRQNLLHFGQSGQGSARKLYYREAWEAEHFSLADQEQVPMVSAEGMALGTADLDSDGKLEILLFAVGDQPNLVLNSDGLPKSGFRSPLDPGVRIVPTAKRGVRPRFARLPPELQERPEPLAWILSVNGRLFAVTTHLKPTGGHYPYDGIRAFDLGERSKAWVYRLASRPFVWAVTDVTGDTIEELLVGTYSEEHGIRVNNTSDTDSCYCLVLTDGGELVWQRAFGAWTFAGCRVLAADLDGDGRREVVAACHTWGQDGGGLFVLDGRTGQILAQSDEGLGRSFESVGCADIDGDGQNEIVAAWSGPVAGVAVYRYAEGRLDQTGVLQSDTGATGSKRLWRLRLLADLDGDRQVEIVLSSVRQVLVCPDPLFYPSRFDQPELLILNPDLAVRQRIELPARAQDVIAGDIIAGGSIELLVRSDRLTLYTSD